MDYKKIFEHQLNHRTIREFKDEPVDPQLVEALLEVANHSATATGIQSFSIIRVTDPEKKRAIAQVGGQEYIARAPELWIFVADCFRNQQIAHEQLKEATPGENDADRLLQAMTDAIIAAQNVNSALESVGLGAVYLGSILNDEAKLVEILNLPKLTFAVLGLGFGVPNQQPQLKPRMPLSLKVFENGYQVEENYLKAIEDYDEEMTTYYDLRDANRRSDSFSRQIVTRLTQVNPKRQEIFKVIRDQGFDLKLD
ncbi:MAG: NADPH-dependent oxidoreductase [Tissierellia bacterium]|nr:NADPH-dependent oxidoreductase [Tissierellia bacterium]